MKKLKSFLVYFLLMAMMIQVLPSKAFAAETSQEEISSPISNWYDYSVISSSTDPLKMNGSSISIKGDVHTNGDFSFQGSKLKIDGLCEASGAIKTSGSSINIASKVEKSEKVIVPDLIPGIKEMIAKDADNIDGDKQYYGKNTAIDKSIMVNGNLNFNSSSVNVKGYVVAEKDINFNVSKLNQGITDKVVICSSTGNININCSKATINGIIYAPNGTVTINSASFILNGRIIADKIVYSGSSCSIVSDKDDLDLIYPLKLIGSVADSKLTLSWDEKDGITKYEVLESSNSLDYESIQQTEKCSFETTAESKNGVYTYRVYAYIQDLVVRKSNIVTVLYANGKATVVEVDVDKDGLSDEQEQNHTKTDSINNDTDNDGLLDGFEIFYLHTNPLRADTDDNGVLDGAEDKDEDGLTNINEMNVGTDPASADTDGDGLLDGVEVNESGSSPFLIDTDEDGLNDYDEWVLKLDPNATDSDGNGITDSEEKINQSIIEENKEDEKITSVKVELSTKGNIENTTKIRSQKGIDIFTSDVEGLVSHPYEIESTSEFEKAKITFKYDKSKLGSTMEDDLMVLWYNEEEGIFVEMPSVIDKANQTLSIETTHFSKYMVVNRTLWYDVWRSALNYRTSTSKGLDIVFAIDSSGSMGWNDPSGIRKTAAKSFVDAFYPEDQGAVVDWDSYAYVIRQLTSDTNAIKTAINTIDSEGGTYISTAITTSIDELLSARAIAGNEKIIILLTDGEDSSNLDAVINRAKANNIKIYTIGLGTSVSHAKLNRLATETGGLYYRALTSAELNTVFEYMKGNTVSQIDKTDADNDGLYDIVETVGIKLSNGKVIFTDPFKADTDGDGLLDGEEIVKDYFSWIFSGNGTNVNHSLFKMKSNPTLKDTDGDGIKDKLDKNPMKKETIETLFPLSNKNKETNATYIDIDDNTVNITTHVRFTKDANEAFPGTSKTYAEVAAEGIETKWKKDKTLDPIVGTDYDFVAGLKGELITNVIYEVPGESYYENVGQKHLNIQIDNESPDWWDENLWAIFGEEHIPHMNGSDDWSVSNVGCITMYNRDQRSADDYTDFQYGATVSHEFGHTLGVGDAYPGANDGKTLVNNAEISDGVYGVDGSIMFRNGLVYSNDIEMVLEAFRSNQWQNAIDLDGGLFGMGKITKSSVIRLPQTFQ